MIKPETSRDYLFPNLYPSPKKIQSSEAADLNKLRKDANGTLKSFDKNLKALSEVSAELPDRGKLLAEMYISSARKSSESLDPRIRDEFKIHFEEIIASLVKNYNIQEQNPNQKKI